MPCGTFWEAAAQGLRGGWSGQQASGRGLAAATAAGHRQAPVLRSPVLQGPGRQRLNRVESLMSAHKNLDPGQVLGMVAGQDHTVVGEWLFKRPPECRLGARVVAIDPHAAFRKALRIWLPRTVVSVDAYHITLLDNTMPAEVGRRLAQETKGRCGRTADRSGPNADCFSRPMRRSWTEALTGSCMSSTLMIPSASCGRPRSQRAAPRVATDRPVGRCRRRKEMATGPRRTRRPVRGEQARAHGLPHAERSGMLILTGTTPGKIAANNTAIKHLMCAAQSPLGRREPKPGTRSRRTTLTQAYFKSVHTTH